MLNLKNLFGKKNEENSTGSEAKGGVVGAVTKLFDKNEKEVARLRPMVEKVAAMGPELKALSDDELKARSAALKQRFRDDVTARLKTQKDPKTGEAYDWQELETEFSWTNEYVVARREAETAVLNELQPEAFALVREAGDRTIGLRHFDVQLIGGAVLHSGRIAEMKTGEGKTLVATTPVYLNALSGRGVHVITVNDYLAERDANWMRPIYEFLGLTVSFLTNDMEGEDRINAYKADVMYATNSEVGFDYLRDNMARGAEDLVQRALNFAIVDEVDNILIDEARTPLIISAQVAKTERAQRRQQLTAVCDKVARKLVPAVTDHEVENLLDSLTVKGSINIDALMEEIRRRGAFTEATQYLIDAYLLSEQSARIENAARLLDVAGEFAENGLIDAAGQAQLEAIAAASVQPANLKAAWQHEIERLTEPFAVAWSNAHVTAFDRGVLADDLALPADIAGDIIAAAEANESEPPHRMVAQAIADEMARRGLIEFDTADTIANVLLSTEVSPELAGAASEGGELAERRLMDDIRQSSQAALSAAVLDVHGNIADVDALLASALPPAGGGELSPDQIQTVVGALEQISQQGLLPFDSIENLWATVRLKQGSDGLRSEITKVVQAHPGDKAQTINGQVASYGEERTAFLQEQAASLRLKLEGSGSLPANSSIAQRAQSGENIVQLRRLLQTELTKSGAYAEAMKVAKAFATEQTRAHANLADHLLEEMGQWVDVSRDMKRGLASLFDEGGTGEQVRERILITVRDLPGENTELPALVSESVKQLQAWRSGSADALLEKIGAHIELPVESQNAIRTAIEEGTYSAGFDNFIGEQLLTTPAAAPLAEAIEAFGVSWDEFRKGQTERLLTAIEGALPLSIDAYEGLSELLSNPVSGKLDTAIFAEITSDAVNRHLEPLLTEENATAFAEEVRRRIPLAKDTQNKLKAADFVGRSNEQLARVINRLVDRSFQIMPFEDYKRVVKNLAWLTEKDEKRRTAALTDMGTLIAEREAGAPVFSEPENFLETLLSTEILSDEEAAMVGRELAESPGATVASVVDRTLRLPAERRRRLSEAKLQEVQSVLDQGIKAHALFQREVNYVVDSVEGKREIVIVDEFTGRKMPGRRYSEGLHEALEAKHGLEVQLESQTVATITIQNYFRLYHKLGGMTGTAKTEEAEFAKTYGIEVVTIPTNRGIQRKDHPDVIYKTAEAKFRAITFEVLECHCSGQPVLVGTRSVEVSERMAERLKPQALQSLVLAHLIKDKIFEDKSIPEADRQQIQEALRTPVVQMNLVQVKNLAKNVGLAPDALHEDNINRLLSLFTVSNPDRNRLTTALRVGLPHNVLNAKNHRNEARIVAEAARPNAVTIATNMAGRGVDIVLGGTLDVESRWRVMTIQTLVRHIEGKELHVRSRNQEATNKLEERLSPQRLQDLAWVTTIQERVDAMAESGALEGQVIKEIRDTLGQELNTPDLKNKVRSRARRLGLLDQLPLDTDPLQDEAPLRALSASITRLTGVSFTNEQLRKALTEGVATQSAGRDVGETVMLQSLSVPFGYVQTATGNLIETLTDVENLDRLLLEAAADTEFDAAALSAKVPNSTPEWATARLKALAVHDAPSAHNKLGNLKATEIEVNEAQIAAALGESYLGVQWLRQMLRDWKLVKGERAYDAPPEMQELVGDNAVVHYHLNQEAAKRLWESWNGDANKRREMTQIEVPNLVLLGDMAAIAGAQAPFLEPQWLHDQFVGLGFVDESEDVFQTQMAGEGTDEHGQVHQVPIDVLIYRLSLNRVLTALDPTLREAVSSVGESPSSVMLYLSQHAAWAERFIDEAWVAQRLKAISGELPVVRAIGQASSVFIETGVAGQSADLVLESEPRPEDIAHTSEQEVVLALGGMHILGTERHESRRIDNQLRGRAGRQGDPGSSRFYVSLEDELWRLFGVRGQALLRAWDEDEAVEHGMITKSIERAQKKVELNHFESRKHVLQYDDVMNVQREVIYRERRRALLGENLRDTVLDMAQQAANAEAEKHCPEALRREEWDTHKLYSSLGRLFGINLVAKHLTVSELDDARSRAEIDARIRELVDLFYDEREAQVGEETLRSVERWQLMRSIDEYWMEHLAEMDYLRDAIWQEGYAQKEPIGVYRQEGFALFQKMLGEIRREVTEQLFSMQLGAQRAQPVQEIYAGPDLLGLQEARITQELAIDMEGDDGVDFEKDADGDDDDGPVVLSRPASSGSTRTQTFSGGQPSLPVGSRSGGGPVELAPKANIPEHARVGRNDPCPCGSGKKYKKCCLPKEQGALV